MRSGHRIAICVGAAVLAVGAVLFFIPVRGCPGPLRRHYLTPGCSDTAERNRMIEAVGIAGIGLMIAGTAAAIGRRTSKEDTVRAEPLSARIVSALSKVRRGRPRDVLIAIGVAVVGASLASWLIRLHFHVQRRTTTAALYAILFEAILGLPALALLMKWKWLRRAGWRTPEWRQLWLLWLPVADVAFTWIVLRPPARSLTYTVSTASFALAVGATEEMWMRGLLLEGLRSRGPRFAVVVSAAVFGAIHLLPVPGIRDGLQALSAFGAGLMWGAARIRIGAIWPLVLIHAAADFPYFLLPSRPGSRGSVSLYELGVAATYIGPAVIVGLVYVLVLTRRSKTEDAQPSAQPDSSPAANGSTVISDERM